MTVGCKRIEPSPLSDPVFFFFVKVNAHFIKHCLIYRESVTRIFIFLVHDKDVADTDRQMKRHTDKKEKKSKIRSFEGSDAK
jgi:hypothetical protein